MGHKWMIDVLDDLRIYAVKNDLPRLAEQIGQTVQVALEEAGPVKEGAPIGLYGNGAGSRGLPDRRGTRPRA